MTPALAVSVLTMLCLGGSGWLWIERQQVQRHSAATAKVTDALNDARLH